MSEYNIREKLNRDHPVFGLSFTWLGDERMYDKIYHILMLVANYEDPEVVTTFQGMVYDHVKEHQLPGECYFCLLALLW